MYRTKAKRNIILSITFKVIILIVGIISRRFIVNYLGNEITGLYSLFVSILGFLSVAELGVGSAIVFSMYKPIVDNDNDQVSSLYYLYKKIYKYIYIVIMIAGLIVTPFLPYLTKGTTVSTNTIYLTYAIFLISTGTTYTYAHKSSFINAHMDNYITNSIRSIFQIFENIIQIVIIILTKSFIWFLVILLISNLLQWITTNIIFKNRYMTKLNDNKYLSNDLKQEVKAKTKAMFSHKIGSLLVNTTESIVISAFVGVSILGVYSNYVLITSSVIGILSLIFSSTVTVIGQAYAKYSKTEFQKQFERVFSVNYIMAFIVFLGFYFISEELIIILFNENVLLSENLVLVITINYFIKFLRQSVLSFRDATGTFYYDRHKPWIEGIINLGLSLLFVYFFGLIGVLMATIITNLTLTHTVEPYVLYKYAFETSPKQQYKRDYGGIILFIAVLILSKLLTIPEISNIYLRVTIKGILSVFLSGITLLFLYLTNSHFRNNVKWLFLEVKTLFKKK